MADGQFLGAGSGVRRAEKAAPSAAQNYGYGRLHSPPVIDLAELRRQQAEFDQVRREIARQNSWLAVPALAPVGVAAGVEAAAALASRAAAGALPGPLSFVEREAWQRGVPSVLRALSTAEKTALRKVGRIRFARANGMTARAMNAEVHHSDPLQWAHLKPNADPNRLANLWGLRNEAHQIATREWAAFEKALNGRVPTQAELMAAKLRIDRLVEPYIRRASVPRSQVPPGKGGPI